MSAPNCHNCVFSVCDPESWLRLMWMGEPIVPRCANHPCWPGQLHDVTGIPCENHKQKPTPPHGDHVRMIPLSEGSYAYVDAADYEWLSQRNWHTASGGYAARNENGKTVFMHRVIMKPPKGKVVDHTDGNRGNNCRSNLRVCTRRENQRNQRKPCDSRSRFKGVSYSRRRKRYFAQYRSEDKHRWLGYFDDPIDAARTYDRAAIEAFGEFARVNFPREWPPERRAEVHALWLEARKKERRKATRTRAKKHPSGGKRGRTIKTAKKKPRGMRQREPGTERRNACS